MPMRHLFDVTPPGGAPYPVWCGDDAAGALAALWQRRWRQVALIGDDTTLRLFAEPLEAALRGAGGAVLRLGLPPGEPSKTRETKARLEDAMLAAGLDRTGCVVAVGGGVVLDLAGFVAATYLRGVEHVLVATTLLAQVDAAVGGKTAVNTAAGKNLVGAFHHPRAVLLDTAALASLPPEELRAGLAEMVKHALVRDAGAFAALERWAAHADPVAPLPSGELIARSVTIKAAVVAEDDRDRGLRHILNCGHTVAHAIERATDHAVPHGHAVGIGMVVETLAAVRDGTFPAADRDRLVSLLARLGLPTRPPCSFAAARAALFLDKKTEAGVLRCAIPQAIGRFEAVGEPDGPRFARAIAVEALAAAWEAACSA